MKIPTIAAILGLASIASAEVFLFETFSDGEGWKDRWTPSTYREDLGKLEVSPGKWFSDEATKAGLRTTEDYRFYAVSTKIPKPFTNKDKDLIIQFDVKNEQDIDCGGSYLKFFGNDFDSKTFNGDTNYNIMFGPDICGPKAMVHAILNYKGTNYDLKKIVAAPKDTLTHTYTLTLKPDQTYSILVDGKEKAEGSLLEDWDFLPPKKIKDPNASKPEDWVDEEMIVDESDVKPDNYDDIPEFIPDPNAKKPEDWDDDMDGEWEAPSIANPDYKGPWSPRMIPNPNYKGEWVHPEIDNPEYKVDNEIYIYDFANVGIDVWQVKSGSIFDNILITDDADEAKKIRDDTKATTSLEEGALAAYNEKLQEEAKKKAEEEGSPVPAEEAEEKIDLESYEPPIKFDEIPEEAAEAVKKSEEEEKKEEATEEEDAKKHVKDEL
ncbi:Calreticulin family-domain-containing protein [Cokeromyces recurvatus]|uniref:Calreticulin family-domain-containing protein n=1 Tax=Cokeromyces recurvatus TaxID=90255 RepID=UPI002220D874|nr:Calreticulin family-domain-containing protein [Cokeromyces recurvatus]KAI7899721.1 Calreticulin family-domain-containing protein [Cokeromyces recurvatus]